MINKINNFFFLLEEDERLNWHDALWFYGVLIAMIALTTFVVFMTW